MAMEYLWRMAKALSSSCGGTTLGSERPAILISIFGMRTLKNTLLIAEMNNPEGRRTFRMKPYSLRLLQMEYTK